MADEKKDPFAADKDLEDTVARMQQANIHPVVEKIQHRFGSLNVIRNMRNQKQVDIANIDKEETGS